MSVGLRAAATLDSDLAHDRPRDPARCPPFPIPHPPSPSLAIVSSTGRLGRRWMTHAQAPSTEEHMLGRQAKIISPATLRRMLAYARQARQPKRDTVIVLLSVKAGLILEPARSRAYNGRW
jgi:hypothetical protein